MLHITNGDSVLTSFSEGKIPGTYLPWRDVLHDGPVPARDSLEAMSDVRAEYHTGFTSGPEYQTARAGYAERDGTLASFADHDELVLWFEHDLYDQLQLLQILDWLAGRDASLGRVSLIQIGEHPDVPNFQGLGQLNGAQLAALLPTRLPVTPGQLVIGRETWRAFCADDPTTLAALAHRHEPEMPFLSAALIRFLEEYPAARDGLTRTERQLLQVIAEGTTKRKAVWWAAQQFETSYWGDLSVYLRLDVLIDAPRPLVRRVDADHVGLTDAGRRILAGEARGNPREIDRWLGGVHLGDGRPDWRWDERDRTVTVSLGG
jgi:hypothetical protein